GLQREPDRVAVVLAHGQVQLGRPRRVAVGAPQVGVVVDRQPDAAVLGGDRLAVVHAIARDTGARARERPQRGARDAQAGARLPDARGGRRQVVIAVQRPRDQRIELDAAVAAPPCTAGRLGIGGGFRAFPLLGYGLL